MPAVMPVAVSIQLKIDDAATISITVAVVSTVSRQTLVNIFSVIVRYQKAPSTTAQTQAAMAPSVGVNRPVVMPPISSTGVMIGSTACEAELPVGDEQQHDAGEHRQPRRRAELRSGPTAPAASRRRPSSSISALPNLLAEKGVSVPHLLRQAK